MMEPTSNIPSGITTNVKKFEEIWNLPMTLKIHGPLFSAIAPLSSLAEKYDKTKVGRAIRTLSRNYHAAARSTIFPEHRSEALQYLKSVHWSDERIDAAVERLEQQVENIVGRQLMTLSKETREEIIARGVALKLESEGKNN